MVTSVFPDWQNNAFIYSPVYSSLVLQASGVNTGTQQDMIDRAGILVNNIPSSFSYFSRCWAIIGILTLNGDVAKAGLTTGGSTNPPTPSPTPFVLNPIMCCPVGFNGLKSFNNCGQYYHCVNGVVTGPAYQCAPGTLFHNNIQNCDWINSFTCDETPCNGSPSTSLPTPVPNSPSSPSPTSAPNSPSSPSPTPPTSYGTCGWGFIGNGICADGTCCSQWGWCGTTDEHCNGPTPPSPTPPSPSPPSSGGLYDNRMIAYMGNWQACPTPQQVAAYTHIVIAFAVSYTWSPGKNICSETCEIATPPVCNNAPNQHLIQDWQNAGKKVLLSFGGAGMGGSWDGNNDCWEYCFGREEQVIDRVSEIVIDMGLDGVDIDYEYYYEDGQNNSPFSKGAEAQDFLKEVTAGLKNKLGPESIIAHA